MKSRSLTRSLLAVLLALAFCLAMAVPSFAMGGSSRSTGRFAGGSGTESDPYLIETIDQLKAINYDMKASYKLIKDLDFANVSVWLPIGYYSMDPIASLTGDETVPELIAFTGTFDGGGHTIKNLQILSENIMAGGVFGFTSGNAKLHDVNLDNIRTVSGLCAGSLIGWASGYTALKNITATNVNNRSLDYAGGICGSSNGHHVTATNCTVKGGSATVGASLLNDNVSLIAGETAGAGGIIGGADCTSFADCHVSDFNITGKCFDNDGFGGLAGCANEAKYITNCSVENVTIRNTAGPCGYLGGLVGFTGTEAGTTDASKRTKISGCSVKNVKIIASDQAENVAGLVGGGTYRSDEQPVPFAFDIENCTVSNVDITTGGKYVGAVVGYLTPNSTLNNTTFENVTLNGKTYTTQIGATPATVPYTNLTQWGTKGMSL